MSLKIKNCRISISFYFFAAAAAIALFCRSSIFFCGLAAAAFHEAGHITTIALSRFANIRNIEIGALGIKISASGNTCTPSITLSGVAANLILAAASAATAIFYPQSVIHLHLCAANICLAACNILPVEPLDGGIFLRLILERLFMPDTADKLVFVISLCFLAILTAAGLFTVIRSRGNFSLLILCLWLLAGILRRYLL